MKPPSRAMAHRLAALAAKLALYPVRRSAATGLPAALLGLDCDRNPEFRGWRTMVEVQGPTAEPVVSMAIELWRKTNWDDLTPHRVREDETQEEQQAAEELDAEMQDEERQAMGQLSWRSKLETKEGMSRYLSYILPIFAALLHGGPTAERWLARLRATYGFEDSECLFTVSPYAFLMLQYVLIYTFKRTKNMGMLEQFQSQMVATTELILDLPFHTFDFTDLAWNMSSFTFGVNLREDTSHYDSFEDFAERNPVPAPYLPPWTFDAPADAALGSLHSHRKFVQAVLDFPSTILVGILHLHDATAWDDWSSLRTAWASIFGETATLQASFYFTRVKGLQGCPEDAEIEARLRAPFKALRGLLEEAHAPGQGLQLAKDFVSHWWQNGRPALRDMEIILCGEPVWLCPLLDQVAQRPMLMRFNMAVLDEFTYVAGKATLVEEPTYGIGKVSPALEDWWVEFHAFVARGRAFASVGTRYTVEQVAYQTRGAVRFPYVPFLGLGLDTRSALAPRSWRDVLLFHNNLPPLLSFKRVLKIAAAALANNTSTNILDMNDLPRGICRPEMGTFEAAILLPHNPAPIRLIDLYAQGVILYVPAEPLIHKWLWANRPFGGYSALGTYRSMPNLDFAKTSAVPPPPEHPPFSGTAYLTVWAINKHLLDRRYWLQYTEWELLPGLQRFKGIPELLQLLGERSPAGVAAMRETMHAHLQARRAEALAWWRAVLPAAAQLRPRPPAARSGHETRELREKVPRGSGRW